MRMKTSLPIPTVPKTETQNSRTPKGGCSQIFAWRARSQSPFPGRFLLVPPGLRAKLTSPRQIDLVPPAMRAKSRSSEIYPPPERSLLQSAVGPGREVIAVPGAIAAVREVDLAPP
uniref:Uncharacterized protein n=1 Tax=Arundo donax TaxID=35708 RepID=A0A0A8ZRA3_ARUDO